MKNTVTKMKKKIIKHEDRRIETSQTKMQEKKYETEDSFNMTRLTEGKEKIKQNKYLR